VLSAHERGELDLDAPIAAYLPAETTAGLHVLRGTTTRTGSRSTTSRATPPACLTTSRRAAKARACMRIVEIAADRTLADLVPERILVPIGLTRTWLPGRSQPSAETAIPSSLHARDRRVDFPHMMQSSNDLMSTTEDLLTFQRAVFDDRS
jgi:D-alanyl-D-alanine carboxypeptidase